MNNQRDTRPGLVITLLIVISILFSIFANIAVIVVTKTLNGE